MGNIVEEGVAGYKIVLLPQSFHFFFLWVINSLLNSKFFNWPKPKGFADNNMFVLGWKEKTFRKRYEIVLFP